MDNVKLAIIATVLLSVLPNLAFSLPSAPGVCASAIQSKGLNGMLPPAQCRQLMGVQLGDTLQSVEALLGTPDATKMTDKNSILLLAYLFPHSLKHEIGTFLRADAIKSFGVLYISLRDNHVVNISTPEMDDQPGVSYAGIGVGESMAQLKKAFGPPSFVNNSNDVYSYFPFPLQVSVDPDQKVVVGFEIGASLHDFGSGGIAGFFTEGRGPAGTYKFVFRFE